MCGNLCQVWLKMQKGHCEHDLYGKEFVKDRLRSEIIRFSTPCFHIYIYSITTWKMLENKWKQTLVLCLLSFHCTVQWLCNDISPKTQHGAFTEQYSFISHYCHEWIQHWLASFFPCSALISFFIKFVASIVPNKICAPRKSCSSKKEHVGVIETTH